MNKRIGILFVVIGYCALFLLSLYVYDKQRDTTIVTDSGRLLPVQVKQITTPQSPGKLQQLLRDTDDVFSIAGMQHTQGGHTMYPNATMLNMKGYNTILNVNVDAKQITVQSGATWDDVQQALNPHGLAIKVSQSQNIFTVGGSLSANIHGRDIRNDALIETVDSFRLLLANGEIIDVSRETNSELFSLVIGGYGLFGVILDVTLNVTDDELYVHENTMFDYTEYEQFLRGNVQEEKVKMHLARISVAPDSFLTEMYATNYVLAEDQTLLKKHNRLKGEPLIAIPKFFLGLSRYSDWGKELFWQIQKTYMQKTDGKLESRNNVMRSDTQFMEYDSISRVEVLQEYFVPVSEFTNYIDDLRDILLRAEDLNVLNITVRYVEKNEEAVLSYAHDDMVALVILINQVDEKKMLKKNQTVIQEMIDLTLAYDGTFYLPYYPFATVDQLFEAYPRASEFFEKKRQYDPDERWMNLFYEEYGR